MCFLVFASFNPRSGWSGRVTDPLHFVGVSESGLECTTQREEAERGREAAAEEQKGRRREGKVCEREFQAEKTSVPAKKGGGKKK